MAMETVTANSNGTDAPDSQVRVQLSTRHPDIALPDNPGPILVNTSNVILTLSTSPPTDNLARPPAVCPIHARQYSIAVRETHTI